ncbi:MAG TPA: hypothetical protein VND65_19660 [Candidatus Binatia bacterium]|nr:hypothetical protein [Candidatus Binatia bacterium]
MSPQFKSMKQLRSMNLELFLAHFDEWSEYVVDRQGDVSQYASAYFKQIGKLRQERINEKTDHTVA